MSLGNKEVMAKNIKKYLAIKGVTATDVASHINVPLSTFSYWVNARTYPRIDKIEMMANYFGVKKSALVEENISLPEFEPEHIELISLFSNLSRDQKDTVMVFLRSLNSKDE